MPVELVQDIIEELANEFGIYGSHDEHCHEDDPCRVCWTAALQVRLKHAVDAERLLYPEPRGVSHVTQT